ncbi:hypothetical protein [Streptomyces xiamenensis]|uniref:hypothetical protein n=1 Tax=Streptomyces xiamenensis TaxID=408015 RepID=UPI0035D781E1
MAGRCTTLQVPGPAIPRAVWNLEGPRWEQLTAAAGKDEVMAADLFAREGWAALASRLGPGGAHDFAHRVALLWVRPDAFAAGGARPVIAAAGDHGLRVLAARPVRVDRAAVRALWAYMCRWATVERLWLLDAVAALGPGLLLLCADDRPVAGPEPAAVRMTAAKGSNDPRRRAGGRSLRDAGGALNRVLTMVHTADEPADVVRELAVFFPWEQRGALIGEAAARLADGRPGRWEEQARAVEAELPVLPMPREVAAAPIPDPAVLGRGTLAQRWAALVAASASWPLLSERPGPISWPEQATREPAR